MKKPLIILACICAMMIHTTSAYAYKPFDSEIIKNDSGHTNRIIIKFRKKKDGIAHSESIVREKVKNISAAHGLAMRFSHAISGHAHVVELPEFMSNKAVEQIASKISKRPDVEYAEADILMRAQFVPNDPKYISQWHYFEDAGGINLPLAWDISTGSGVTVAVIDTGITIHSDLNGQVLPGYDFISSTYVSNDLDGRDSDPADPGDWVPVDYCSPGSQARNSSWHGTHVGGTIAAVSNNSTGVAGVAFNARILPLRVLGRCGGFISDISDAIRWAAGLTVPGVSDNQNPAKVINLSLGGTGTCGTTYSNAISEVTSMGVSVVAAAGNNDVDVLNFRPANCPGVITVAATKRDGGRAYYSNYGNLVDIAAPGGELYVTSDGVLSTLNSGTTVPRSEIYAAYQGTSMATPHVSGVIALMYSLDPRLTPEAITDIIKSNARSFPPVPLRPCDIQQCGAGILDAYSSVKAVQEQINLDWLPVILNYILQD